MRKLAVLAVVLLAACGHPVQAAERALAKEVVVQAPVEAVWKAWTTAEGLQSFLAPEAVVDPRPDGAFDIHFNPYAQPGMKGADGMRVMAVQEDRLLSFTWNAPPHLPVARAQRTFVTVRMEPAGNATQVRIHHGGWGDGGEWDKAYDYFDKAWTGVLANLQKRFVEGPRDWKEWLAAMKAMQEKEAAAKR